MDHDQAVQLNGRGLLRLLAMAIQVRFTAQLQVWELTDRQTSATIEPLIGKIDEKIERIGTFILRSGATIPDKLAELAPLTSIAKTKSNGETRNPAHRLIADLEQLALDIESLQALLPGGRSSALDRLLTELSEFNYRAIDALTGN